MQKTLKKEWKRKNGKEFRKEFRDKAREAKKESTANHLKYEEAIKYGPIFICVCCHCAFFKETVKIFSDLLQEKILPDILDAFCIFDTNFKDRQGQSNYYICHNCFKIMKSDKKVPSLSVKMSYIWKSYPLNYNWRHSRINAFQGMFCSWKSKNSLRQEWKEWVIGQFLCL